MEAYGVADFQISGGPGWINSEHYDIDAKAEGLAGTDQLSRLMQDLLADRFKMEIHHSTKELPIFVLVVGKSGPKIRQSEELDPSKMGFVSRARIDGEFTIAEFAKKLQPLLGRPVIDRTELSGKYGLKLEWTPDPAQGQPVPGVNTPSPADSNGPTIFTAMQAPLLFSSDGQVNAMIPYGIQVNADQQIAITRGSTYSVVQGITMAPAAPGIFSTDGSGKGQGVIYVAHPDSTLTLADAAHPATAGDIIVITCTGLGEVTPALTAGTPAPSIQSRRRSIPWRLPLAAWRRKCSLLAWRPDSRAYIK